MDIKTLKDRIVNNLLQKGDDLEKLYIGCGNKIYTKGQIIDEIMEETDLGMELIGKLIGLTIDLLDRGNTSLSDKRF